MYSVDARLGGDTGPARHLARFSRYAKATFKKDRRLNIRLSSKDLEAIQKRALAEGLPYQTLIASLLHEYASGRLKEVQLERHTTDRIAEAAERTTASRSSRIGALCTRFASIGECPYVFSTSTRQRDNESLTHLSRHRL